MKEKSLQERWGKEVLTQVEFNSYVKGGWVGGGGGLHVHCIKFKKEALQASGWWLLLFSSIRWHLLPFLWSRYSDENVLQTTHNISGQGLYTHTSGQALSESSFTWFT